MSDDHKKRVRQAMQRHHQKLLQKETKPKRNHRQVELEEVEKPCLKWMRNQGWEVEISKAEATWDINAGRFTRTALQSGMTDSRGWDSSNRPFYVEFKAPGCLKNVWGSPNKANENRQGNFIIKQIGRSCFAVVVDDLEMLKKLWRNWTTHMDNGDVEAAQKYLLDALPPKPKRRKKNQARQELF